MALTLSQLAEHLDVELRGDAAVSVSSAAGLQQAGPGALSFLANPRYRKYLSNTRASAVIVSAQDAQASPVPVLISANPYACFARAVRLLYPERSQQAGIHPTASIAGTAQVDPGAWIDAGSVIGEEARVGSGVQIGPGCIIGSAVRIGEGSRLVARVTVLAESRIGRNVILHPGVVIGSDGFGMARQGERWQKVPQIGSVQVGDDVEIGANTTVDRGALENTVIEEGVKIDNQVQIAHNVFIGAHSAIAACVGIAGSTRIGRHCTLAGGVGIVGHLEVTDHVHITGMSMVTRSIRYPGTYSAGTPLMDNLQWRRNAIRIKQLDNLTRRVSKLEKSIKNK